MKTLPSALDTLARLHLCEDELDRLTHVLTRWERQRVRWRRRSGPPDLVRRSHAERIDGVGFVIADLEHDGEICGELWRLAHDLLVELSCETAAICVRGEEFTVTGL
jgi:hypothetical protein